MSDFLKRRIQERDGQRRGTQETSAPASSFLQQRIQQRDTQRAESGYRAPTGTHKTMLGMSLEEYKAKLDEALAAWKSTSATTESGLANPKEAQARKTYQTMRKQYKALQQRESEKQQAQAAQQEYDELRVADLNALKEKMDAAKESADGSAKERVVAGSIVKQKDSGAQAAYEEAARKYNLAQQIQYDERGAQALGKLSEEEAAAVDTLAKSTNKGRKTDIVGAGVIDEMRRKATKVLADAGYSAEEIDELANWRARQQNAQKYDAAVEKREALADKGFWGAAAATALSVPETLLSGIGVIDVAVQNNENRGTDRPADYKRTAMLPYAKATAGRSTISNKLEQNTDAEIFGQNVAAGAYNIGTSMLDSTAVAGLAALGVPPLAATSLLGGAAATSAMVDAKDRGVSDEQAVLTGLAAGVAESLFEEVSLEKLLKLKPAVGTLGQRVRTTIKNVGLQAATEGSEEFFTTLANTMTDNLINGGLSEFQKNLRGYMEQGMSEEEARRRAYLDLAGQLALDFGGGAIAGGLMAGGQTAIQTGQRNAAIAQEYGDIARGAAQERLETNAGDRLAQDVQNHVSSNRRVGGGAIAELVSRNVQAQNAQTQTAIAEAAAQRLTELGETENVEAVAQAAARLTADPTMSTGRRRAAENVLKGSRYGERVLGELTEGMQAGSAESAPAAVQEQSTAPSAEQVRQAVESTQRSRGAQNLTESRGGEERTQSGRRFASEWAGNLPQVLTEDAYVRRLKELRVNPQATDSRTVTGTAYNKESGKLDVIVRGTDGKVETIPAAKAATTARQERLMELAADVGEAGPQMFAAIRDGQDVETYARQWKNAYTYGESNIPRAYAMQSDAVKYLTAEQRDIAYEAGKAAYGRKQAQAREKRAARGNDTPKAKKGAVKLTGAVIGGKRYDGVSKASLTERQRANLKVLGQVAQATGIDIVLYQSRANARGEYEGQNGAYKDGTLYLDINAGRNRVGDLSEVAVVRTAAHELTHFIQDYNPAAYAEYRDYVVGLLIEEQGMDFDALVEHKQALQNDLSYDEAVDEVVADGSEMLLRDTAAVQRLAEENRGLFQKIRSWLRKWLENIKKAFDGVGAEHAEAKALEQHLEELQKRWDDALVGASRNLQRSKAEAESAGEKASVRGKYWRPDLNRSEWNLLNRRMTEEIESSEQYLDESTKWLYADEKGVQVFALYGIGDGTEATPLYAVGGKQARYAASLMQDVIEEVGRSDGNAEGFDSWAENLRSKNGNYRRNYAQAGDGKPAGRNAGLHGRSQGRNTGKPAGDGKGKPSGVREKFSLRDYGLTEDEEHAIVSYKSGDSYALNGKLATGGELTELQRALRDHLDTALEKLPVYKGTVYRHYDFDSFGGYEAMAEFLSMFEKGKPTPMKSYLPASTVRNEDRTNGEYTIDMVIQSETGRSLNGFGRNTENEVLLPRTVRLAVDSMELVGPHKIRMIAREVVENGEGTTADARSDGMRDVRESALWRSGLRPVSERNSEEVLGQGRRDSGRDRDAELSGLREGEGSGSLGGSGVESDYRAAEEGLKYQPREQSVSDRQILANVLERVAQNERERSILADYREKAAKMAFYERELAKREQKIADHRSGKAVLEPDKLRRAEISANKYAALISQQDERLLRLEKLKPLRDVVTRERDFIAERLRGAAEEKGRYTAEFERQLSEERRRGEERLQQYRKGREERDDIRVERWQIEKLAKRLTTYLEENTDKKHIPEALKKPIGELLQSLDFSSRTKLSSGAATKADLAYIRSMQRIEGVLAAQERWDETGEGGDLITGTLDLPKGFREALTEQIERVQTIMETHQPGERAVMRMNLADLRKLRVMLSTLSSAVTKMNELFANGQFRHVDQAAQDTIFTLREKGQHQSLLPKVESFVRWDNTLPWYAFQRLGEGGQSIFAELQDGWDKLAFNTQKILKFRKELIDDKTARKWDTEVHEVELTDQDDNTVKAKLTTAQLMSLYCLSRRKQALGHLLGGGIRPADIELTANIKDKVLKKTEKQDTHYHLTDERLGQLLGLLTDEQREIAQKMQKYMTEQGATWGNEITMARWGYRAFTEENYFPLTTDREDRPARADDASEGSLYRLQNISATKPLTQNANNAVMLYSIFDVYADHMADMAKYNAMVLPILDAQKWYNYKEGHKNEAGQVSTWTVQRTLTQVYGRDANRFVIQFLKDLNGVKENGARGEGLAKKMISNYKRAAVAANLRVALLQPTAYVRASAVLDAKYLTRAFGERTSTKEATAEMLARSGIGLWKSMGMFDTDVGRSIRDQIKGKGSAVESLVDKTMVLAEKGDSITWARLWRACKLEVADKQHLSGEQLLDATAKRFREVIYRTQVIDSTMTRSHLMRSGSTFAAIFTSFMSEPTVSYNLIMTASEKIWEDTKKYGAKMSVKRNWKTAGRAWQAYILSAVASAMVEALADAWRDPGDDKDTQKLLNAFLDNLGSDLNPLNKLPGLRDIFSIFEGYDTNRTDMAAFSNLNKAIAIWKETIQLANGTIDEATDTTYHGNMTIYGKVYKTAQALSQLSGLPVSATMREAQALWNNTVGRWAPGLKQKTYDNEKQRLIQKAGTAMWNGDKDAWQDAYAALEQYMLADGKSKREAESAVYSEMRKAVKDSYLAGELTEAEARQKLVDFLGSDAEKAAQQVTSWKNGSEFAKEAGFEYGEMRSAYETGRIQKSEAVRLRQKYGGETQDEAESKVRYWDFCIEYPQYDDISEARANKYYDYCRQAGVGVAAYYKAAQYTAAIVSEKDEDGNNVSGSVKRQYVEYIQSLGLSAAQQKALWQALKNATWSDKGTPWE